ncbi:hypothetical protein SAMN05444162_3932 [Paenibacillaceae bacterium GAS479]|nr:hypothetical protein SAMN05444162_3932 [Paenibacillaceae bacterium GAS479]
MKRVYTLTIVAIAAVSLIAGCSASSSSDRYASTDKSSTATAETSNEQSPSVESTPPDALTSPAPSPSTSPAAEAQSGTTTSPTASPTPSPSTEPSASPTAKSNEKPSPPPKAADAKKSNESITKAATGSIMKKDSAPSSSDKKKNETLNKSIEEARSLIKQLKQDAEDGDDVGAKETSAQLIKAWDSMKSDVNEASSEMHDFIGTKMNGFDSIQKADTVDHKALLQLDYELYQAFRQLAEQVAL